MNMHQPRPVGRRGWSVTELMVCVAIIGLLMGLLFPALAGFKGSARRMHCQSQLRQMAVAAQQYAMIHDHWPHALLYEMRDGLHTQRAWDWETPTFGGGEAVPGVLWTFTDNPGKLMQCPDAHLKSNFADPHTGYNYNTSSVGSEERFTFDAKGTIRHGCRPHAFSRSCQCALFGDGAYSDGTNKFMRAPGDHLPHRDPDTPVPALGAVYAGGQAFRHRGETNAVFVDGHVTSLQEPHVEPDATEALLSIMAFPRNGFLSSDDSAYRAN